MSRSEATYIGEIQSVTGSIVSIKVRQDLLSALVLVDGESHRVGQVGSFLRIPLGYMNLYAVCTQVGAAAAPNTVDSDSPEASRWMSAALFGEGVSAEFERGVSQFPTVGDECHLVTAEDLKVIYSSISQDSAIEVGTLGSAHDIPARLDLAKLVTRHSAIVGSTGAGKSNAVAVFLESIAPADFPSARILVIDPHGEYGTAIGDRGYVFRVDPTKPGDKRLIVPFWALPFDELANICLGKMQEGISTSVRDEVRDMKVAAATAMKIPINTNAVTADSPIPFSIKKLWFDLDDYERATFQTRTFESKASLLEDGDAEELRPNLYPPPAAGTVAPFKGPRRGLTRQLEFMRSRIADGRYTFLFGSDSEFSPDLIGTTKSDLHTLVESWVGHDRQITVLDLSGLPSEVMAAVAGTLLRLTYDALFWAGDLPVSGRAQPLLIMVEEAHRVIPIGADTPAHRTAAQIAKEGRKYGVGLMVITQRPTEIDPGVLSQCGTIVALRLSNSADRSSVAAVMPDDLGGLTAMLPALRTGEALVIGEAMPVPSRIRFRKARSKPTGDDPKVVAAWRKPWSARPDAYQEAVAAWRRQQHPSVKDTKTKGGSDG